MEVQKQKPLSNGHCHYKPHDIKKFIGEDANQAIYSRHKRHVFVMTQMAKPIYVRYGDEIDLSPFLATLNTIVEKFITYFGNDKQRSKFQKIAINDKDIIYVLYKKQLYYICKTSKDDCEFLIQSMLEFLNLQTISIVTDIVNKRLIQKVNYDFRNLLSGTHINMGLAIKNGLTSPSILLRSYMPVPMSSAQRHHIHSILKEFKNQEYCQCILLLTHTNVIDMWFQKDFMLHAQDIILIQNLLQAQSSFSQSENWLPICLPGLSADGCIFLYQSYLSEDIAVCMISDETNSFQECKMAYSQIQDKLNSHNYLAQLQASLALLPYKNNFTKIPSLIHYMVKKIDDSQFSLPNYTSFGKQDKQFKSYLLSYAKAYEKYLKTDQENKKEFITFNKTKDYYSGLYGNLDYLIFFIMDKFVTMQEINQYLNVILKFVKEEDSRYFIQKFN